MTLGIEESSHSTNQTRFANTPERVLVTLSGVNASAGEEAAAVLKALGFTAADITAFNEKYGIDIKAFLTHEFSKTTAKVTKDVSSKPGFQAYIGINSHNYKLLTGFIAERRNVSQVKPIENGNGGSKIGDKNNQAKLEENKLNQLLKDAQILPTTFGTPSKLRDLKHISGIEMQNISGLSAEDKALAGYIEQRYGDRSNLYGDDKADILRIARTNGVKVENLSVSNGTAEFDISVESLLKLHIAYIGVQEKVNQVDAIFDQAKEDLALNQFLKGVGEGAWATLKHNWEMVTHPIETIQNLKEAVSALSNLSKEDLLKIYQNLKAEGYKFAVEKDFKDVSRDVGKVVGAIAVELALGKGAGMLLKALKGVGTAAEIVDKTKKIGNFIGKTPIPTVDVKVVQLINGNKIAVPNVELTKLADIIKTMKSSEDKLGMLDNGSTLGKQAISEIAEQGLTEKAQSGLKALRGSLSKEGLKLAKEKLVVLNVARNELIARFDNLIVNSNFLSDTKNVLKNAKNSLKDHLTQDDLVGALRDKFGKEVKRSGDGKVFNHLGEVNDSIASMNKAKDRLVRELGRNVKGSVEYKRISKEIDAIKELERMVNLYLEIK